MFSPHSQREFHAVNLEITILASYGKRVVKNEDTEQTTGFASMIIPVPQKNVILLLRNSGKDGLVVRQTQRANQELMQTEAWMPVGEHADGCAASAGQDDLGHWTDTSTPRRHWAIGRIPYSTTPLQLSDALWNWSGGVGTPWKVIPLRVPPHSKEEGGVGQTWLLGAERPSPALELTSPSGKAFFRAEMTGAK